MSLQFAAVPTITALNMLHINPEVGVLTVFVVVNIHKWYTNLVGMYTL
jgi:hypothetical protein